MKLKLLSIKLNYSTLITQLKLLRLKEKKLIEQCQLFRGFRGLIITVKTYNYIHYLYMQLQLTLSRFLLNLINIA